ncbi:gliding motility-associated C-terminal domain-containing protein [Salegentibacter holothuriorum]|uniref:Gliding motility-associated C-terminal domain-containing protein n=1 Tax=Salegentibacter holothuriorum TaxID=241145 RepID=A0A1T5AAL2_9FLAO|nr:T9SS type B sorting domain-containing protein [Salegentibacter holothuriorum]SKB32044.1 gliding motility-associated C-terminal domain-containing protein [Salegentibacter holothuriorum]
MKVYPLVLLMFLCTSGYAQLGFCEGSKGDPIFHEDFESATELPSGTTNYIYVNQDPQDGAYTVSSQIGNNITTWHSSLPPTTVSNRNALIVNASYTSGLFYQTEITGLCENTSYEFSAFLMNIYDRSSMGCENGGIPINVRFEIWDETDSNLLKEGNTGDIPSLNSPKWEQYALTFQTKVGQEAVILKMYNNGVGGCGNDLAIDDIIFRSCGDFTIVTSENGNNRLDVCAEEAPVNLSLEATPDFSVYNTHAYQWQESSDNENWTDIAGETDEKYNTPSLNNTRFYRVKVAEDPVNLNTNLCSSVSEIFTVNILKTPNPPESDGNVSICSDDEIPELNVEIEENETANWYDENNNLIAENTTSYLPKTQGIYYVQAINKGFDCQPSSRTAINFTINESPQVEDEVLQLCDGGNLILDAGLTGLTYKWSTGETAEEIEINTPGGFSVILTTPEGCSTTKNFEINRVDIAKIERVNSDLDNIIITPANKGDFEYSLDGNSYQTSNIFTAVSGGIYTIYMRDLSGCNIVTTEFPHIVIPKFITPNADGYNDTFSINGLEYFPSSEIRIFDRYGKLLKSGAGETFKWNGTLNGRALPSNDYWYHIIIEGFKTLKGSFSLKR